MVRNHCTNGPDLHSCNHSENPHTHDLPKLLDSAGLGMAFEQEAGQDRIFKQNWSVVRDWTEETRYQSRGQRQAEEILAAINDPEHGVLQWLRRNW